MLTSQLFFFSPLPSFIRSCVDEVNLNIIFVVLSLMRIVCLGCVACVMAWTIDIFFECEKPKYKKKKKNNKIIDSRWVAGAMLCSLFFSAAAFWPHQKTLFVQSVCLFVAIDFGCLWSAFRVSIIPKLDTKRVSDRLLPLFARRSVFSSLGRWKVSRKSKIVKSKFVRINRTCKETSLHLQLPSVINYKQFSIVSLLRLLLKNWSIFSPKRLLTLSPGRHQSNAALSELSVSVFPFSCLRQLKTFFCAFCRSLSMQFLINIFSEWFALIATWKRRNN